MTSFLLASSAWAIASAVAIVAIGIVSLAGGKTRPRGALAFGLFGILWGSQIALGNVASVAPVDLKGTFFLLFLATAVPVNYVLVEFAASQSPTGGRTIAWNLARLLAGGLALGTAVLFVFEPRLIYAGQGASGFPARGPLFVPLFVMPQFAGFALALFALYRAYWKSPTPRTRMRAAILLAGLGLYTGFTAGFNISFYIVALQRFPHPDNAPLMLVFTALATLALGVAWRLARARAGATRDETRESRALALALVAPFAWGLLEGWLSLGVFPLLNTVGLWRILGMGIVAYGLARWRLFDLPQRARTAAASASGAAAAVAGGAAAYGAGALLGAGVIVPALVGALVVLGTFLPGVRFARRIFASVAGATSDAHDDALYGQRIDAYRAALEASIARGTLQEDRDFHEALRVRFGIDVSEARVLLHYARSSVLVAREEGGDAAYERLRLLGEGGAGRTWLARDRLRDRLVVLKEPLERWQRDPALREAVLREARLTARVRHRNVVAIEEVVEHDGRPVLVMEYCENGSLADRLRREGPLPWPEAVRVATQVLHGVEAIHAAGIVHRDLKPSNVLLSRDGSPKVADFGIAIPLSSSRTLLDGSTTIAGTLSYLAPEVRAGSLGDRRSDVYACGALLYELLHGAPPGLAPQARPDVPPALTEVLARALHADPAKRPQTAEALVEALTMVVGR